MTDEAFRAHQIEVHVSLVLSLSGLQDYRLQFFPPQADATQTFDAMASVTFESRAAHDAALASDARQRALADVPNMVEVSATVVLGAGAE
ncbi:MAG: EthD family reductase, partial [Roseicyclus sp.]